MRPARDSIGKRSFQAAVPNGKTPGSRFPNAGGFTLLELLTALAIVAVLATAAVPLYSRYLEKARVIRAVADIRQISQSLTSYQLDHGAYPQSLAAIGFATLRDPWGSPYRYLNIQTATPAQRGRFRRDRFLVPINTDYDLYSAGRDHQSISPLTAAVSQDDVVRANNGGYIGLASGF